MILKIIFLKKKPIQCCHIILITIPLVSSKLKNWVLFFFECIQVSVSHDLMHVLIWFPFALIVLILDLCKLTSPWTHFDQLILIPSQNSHTFFFNGVKEHAMGLHSIAILRKLVQFFYPKYHLTNLGMHHIIVNPIHPNVLTQANATSSSFITLKATQQTCLNDIYYCMIV